MSKLVFSHKLGRIEMKCEYLILGRNFEDKCQGQLSIFAVQAQTVRVV